MHLLVAVPFLFNLVLATINGENPCRYVDSAGIIDLTSLGHTDGTPAFPDISQSASSWMQYCDRVVSFSEYSFNPCKPFTEGTTCKDVAVCQVPFTSGESFILAKHDSAVWIPPIGFGGSATLTYTYQTKHVKISMQCTKDTEVNVLEIISESPQETYNMKLSSKCACFDGCKNKPGPDPDKPNKGLSGGAVLLIIVVVLVFIYLITFMSFNKFKREATGLDILPHRSFWISLPGYSKDGVIFIFQKLTNKGATYQTV
ncbi:unnamed protein product [Rotaria socialis]|uniref:Cation-dependent mannose-6-phosphate receptor n=1 Tax=Rotaria socialis TaxID=392032 RepID=A0A817QBW9_9BILA|nr:unnamed protein product [Rotaria socialis]